MLTTDINSCAHRQKLSSIDEIDSILCAIADETNNVVGANATLPISIAATHAIADSYGLSTWRYISTLGIQPTIPTPMMVMIEEKARIV